MAAAAMNAYLQHTLGVNPAGMRTALTNNGFNNVSALVNKKKDYVSNMCAVIRRSSTTAANKNIIRYKFQFPWQKT